MKKTWILGLVVVALAALAVGVAVPALADRTPAPAVTAGTPVDTAGGYVTMHQQTLARAAEALGLTVDELTARLENGETLAQVAQAQGVAEETLIDAIVAPIADQLTLNVRYGYLTQEEADARLQAAKDNAADYLTRDLSTLAGNAGSWEEMEEYCEDMMGGFGGMMGGWQGQGGFGGMMNGWNWNGTTPDTDTAPRAGRGFGGMMGGGFGGGMMGW